jgi:PadR family transcriptional regulator PadR
MEPAAGNVATQLRRGVLEHCVLAVLARSPEYAFELVRRLSAVDGLVTSEGTIYPLLSRLSRDGMVSTTWQPSDAGPPRKYYDLTAAGRRALDAFVAEWSTFTEGVDDLLRQAGAARARGARGDRRDR